MPFRSVAQQRHLFMHNPAVAKEFAKDMKPSDYHRLPQKVGEPKRDGVAAAANRRRKKKAKA